MDFTTEELIKGNGDILQWYKNAMELWAEIFAKYDLTDETIIPKLSEELSLKQMTFEHNCGTRWIGQEIMVVTGIGQFYKTSVGFDDMYGQKEPENRRTKAFNLYKAFQLSSCSIEVKYHAKEIAKNYDLIEEDRL